MKPPKRGLGPKPPPNPSRPRLKPSRDLPVGRFKDPRYGKWRDAVLLRDGHKCRKCRRAGTEEHPLHAHHIKPWAEFAKLRFVVENGLTVCENCHKILHAHKGQWGIIPKHVKLRVP